MLSSKDNNSSKNNVNEQADQTKSRASKKHLLLHLITWKTIHFIKLI